MNEQPPKKLTLSNRVGIFWRQGFWPKIIILVTPLCFICICISLLTPSTPKTAPAPAADLNAAQTAIMQTAGAPFTQTAAALPKDTPAPTKTPTPVPSATATQAPIILTGSGDSVVDIVKNSDPSILRIKYTGGGNFAVLNYDSNNNRIDLLVNTIGSYEGTVPLDFLLDEHTARFEITASGPWEFQILPLIETRHESVPGVIQGKGDDVIYLSGSNLDLLKADASHAQGNFAIWSYGDDGRDLVINEIAPYTGTVLLSRSTYLIVVAAEGPWSVEITTK